jgi:hypothetical protein
VSVDLDVVFLVGDTSRAPLSFLDYPGKLLNSIDTSG